MSDKREGNEFPFVSCVFRWFWRDLVKCYVSVQVTYLFFCFVFSMNGNTERAKCALSRVCIP